MTDQETHYDAYLHAQHREDRHTIARLAAENEALRATVQRVRFLVTPPGVSRETLRMVTVRCSDVEWCACKEVTLARGQLEKVTDSRYRRTTHYRECCNVVSPIPKPEPVPQSYVESLESRIKVALALCEAWDDNAADAIEAALRGESA